ncbi:LacI family DNA-binding transcriptional regulator, partial [Streptomyces sp. NPDC005069]
MSPAKVQSPQEKASADVPSQSTATLAEIARAAGVSAPTVSKVLNG